MKEKMSPSALFPTLVCTNDVEVIYFIILFYQYVYWYCVILPILIPARVEYEVTLKRLSLFAKAKVNQELCYNIVCWNIDIL